MPKVRVIYENLSCANLQTRSNGVSVIQNFQVFKIYVLLFMTHKSMSHTVRSSKELCFLYIIDLFYVGIIQRDKVYANS